ncbi:class I SAM-dependent methyltransferase [Allosalinactinospora lopnorensis]|uniref:class I SAM-dependent methyltransferase n=1 Tax=Allosalinactinospora lopnorensis TaxID=1352348 RepID=UPI000698FCBE|nr:class I SAM-dependent methyltransferase [Allosalinactinospora lopnorensis]
MSPQPLANEGPGHVLAGDYDEDPDRFAANQRATERFLARNDVHPDVAERFAAEARHLVVDIGGGNGTLARLLGGRGIRTVVVDRAGHIAQAPRPAVRADALQLPFPDNTFDGAAALWMLYHLADPVPALREAHRYCAPTACSRSAPPAATTTPNSPRHSPGGAPDQLRR